MRFTMMKFDSIYWNLWMSSFAVVLSPISRYWHLKYLTLKKVGKCQRVSYSQWCHSIANIEIYKSHLLQFALALAVFEIVTFEIFDLKTVGPGHGVQHWQCRRQMANVEIYKRHFLHILFSSRFDLCERFLHTDTHTHTHTHTQSATWQGHGCRQNRRFA